MDKCRTILQIMQANPRDLSSDEHAVMDAFLEIADVLARRSDALASGRKYGFVMGVSEEMLKAMAYYRLESSHMKIAINSLKVLEKS